MHKLTVKKKLPVKAVILSVGIFALMYISYYLFALRPQTQSAKALAYAKQQLMGNLELLQEERLVHTTLLTLDPGKFDYADNVSILLQKSKETENKISGSNTVNLKVLGTKETKNLIREINSKLPQMLKDSKQIASLNSRIFMDYSSKNALLSKVTGYDPEEDLAELDPVKDNDEISQRADSALMGLQKISDKLSQSGQFDAATTVSFNNKIQSNISLLRQISAAANNKNSTLTKKYIAAFLIEYNGLKNEAKKLSDQALKTDEAKQNLTLETNLINTYQQYIDKINNLQMKIIPDPLSISLAKLRSSLHLPKKTQSVMRK